MVCHPGGAYLRFRIRNSVNSQQHNALITLAKKHAVYYCIPLFRDRTELSRLVAADEVINRSRMLRVAQFRPVRDTAPHNITVDPDGGNPHFHSEPSPLEPSLSWTEILRSDEGLVGTDKELIDTIDEDHLRALYVDIEAAARLAGPSPNIDREADSAQAVVDDVDAANIVARIAALATRVLGLSWYMIP